MITNKNFKELSFFKKVFFEAKTVEIEKLCDTAQKILVTKEISPKTRKCLENFDFSDPDKVRLLFEEFIQKQFSQEIPDSYIFTNEQRRLLDKAADLAKSDNAEEIEKCIAKAFKDEYEDEAEFMLVVYGFKNEKSLKKMIQLYLEDKAFENNVGELRNLVF